MSPRGPELRAQILDLAEEYFREQFPEQAFVSGQSTVPVSGKVLSGKDLRNLVDAALDGWLTTGRFAKEFERRFARLFGVRGCSLVNSGSSANLVAFSALTSPKLGDRRLKPGDEVITLATGFPTTVNPIIQNQCVPVFVDISLPTYQLDASLLEGARSERTRAIMFAHTLGNVCDLEAVVSFAKKHDVARRRQLRRAGFDLQRQDGGDVRRPGDGQFLSGASHNHGRRRSRGDGLSPAEDAGRVVPRLGPGLLV
jgi:CDP-4-dehydro-6-deoxyglucose reductase, E1